MELVESIESINEKLLREFGRELDNQPRWRVVLAGELLEKRLIDVTDEGFELLNPEVREVRKYKHIPPNYYVLERRVPVVGETDLLTKMSDEPAWTFEDRFGNYLPPRYDACKLIIENIYNQMDKSKFYAKYADKNKTPEELKKQLDDMEFALFGNETSVGDALAHGFGVSGFHQKTDFSGEKTS